MSLISHAVSSCTKPAGAEAIEGRAWHPLSWGHGIEFLWGLHCVQKAALKTVSSEVRLRKVDLLMLGEPRAHTLLWSYARLPSRSERMRSASSRVLGGGWCWESWGGGLGLGAKEGESLTIPGTLACNQISGKFHIQTRWV